ncbi:MAG: lytic transglycosylase domain-containing protein [Pseudomonadota bacterium]
MRAAREASERHGVPPDLMEAIALVETGRRIDGQFLPWPWALNVEGQGSWHRDADAAAQSARAHLAAGRRSIDLGCFQINHRWHGDAFASPEAMLEPRRNADYAARFLAALHHESGDWMVAAGHYHSRTPALARSYRERVASHLPGGEPSADGPRQERGGSFASSHAANRHATGPSTGSTPITAVGSLFRPSAMPSGRGIATGRRPPLLTAARPLFGDLR